MVPHANYYLTQQLHHNDEDATREENLSFVGAEGMEKSGKAKRDLVALNRMKHELLRL